MFQEKLKSMDSKLILNNKNIIIAGGGTGGHLFPAMAIGDKLEEYGANIIYFGSKYGIESTIHKEKQKKHYLLNIRGIQRGFDLKSIGKNILFPFRFCSSLIYTLKKINKSKPIIIIGTGGYSSGIPLFCARILRIPILLHEQNSFPGITTRYFSKKAKTVCIANKDSKKYINSDNIKFTGNPIRKSINKIDVNISRKKMKLDGNKFTLFFMGGSQGSKPINEHLMLHYKFYLEQNCQIIWQCGNNSYEKINAVIQHPDIHLKSFINKIDLAYSSASIVICRSGAISLAELTACGKAMILIPFPQAAGNHQEHNAFSLEKQNAAKVVLQSKLKSGLLEKIIMELKNNPEKIIELERCSARNAVLNATDKIVIHIMELAA